MECVSCKGKLKHLGITAPHRSTLAYANGHRPWQLYELIFLQLLDRCRLHVGDHKKFRFKNKLVSLDSTTIDLCLSMFNWVHFRRAKREPSNSICSWIMMAICLPLRL